MLQSSKPNSMPESQDVVGRLESVTAFLMNGDRSPVKLLWPDLMSFDWRAATIAIVAALLVFLFKRGMLTVLGASALLGLGLSLV